MFYNGFEYEIIDGEVTITGYKDKTVTEIVIPSEIEGYSVTKIGRDCFNGDKYLKSVTIPDSVTKIGPLAFCGCYSLETINIPDSVTEIGACAFYNCALLKSINIPNSVTYIGGNCFHDCTSLKKINGNSYSKNFCLINSKFIESYDWFYKIKHQIGDDYCTNHSAYDWIIYFINGKKCEF